MHQTAAGTHLTRYYYILTRVYAAEVESMLLCLHRRSLYTNSYLVASIVLLLVVYHRERRARSGSFHDFIL